MRLTSIVLVLTGWLAPLHAAENRLARETSPYLLLHAHNPVDWYPWGPEAFEKAKRENKPIFLSVGYSSCFWCHVMERKVFMSEKIARYMNEHFVNIKVDREERPDVDDIYMTALTIYYQAIGASQGGGWPLSMFLTPDGKPFAGGTYFPPEDTDGHTGCLTVMRRIVELWEGERTQIDQNAEFLTRATKQALQPRFALPSVKPERKLVDAVAQALVESADPQFGGLDFSPRHPDGPKFPVPAKLALLRYQARERNEADATRVLDLTLRQMADGGIYDHLAGGFHRYSTDRQWHVPHFEKMLYDQAQLADVYVAAWKQHHLDRDRRTAEGTLQFVLDEMTDPRGGFYSALDAETDGVEGAYYVWSAAEIEKLLPKEDAGLFKRVYGIEAEPAFEPGNVPRLTRSLDDWSKELGLSREALDRRLTEIRSKLLAVRKERKSPLRDDKVLTSWNGLMIRAFANAGKTFERPEYVAAAERAAEFLLTHVRDDEGHLLRTYRAKQAKLNAYLDDYAFLIDGLLALHEATGDAKWLDAAKRLMDDQRKLFKDEHGPGYYFTSHAHEELLARTKNAYDSVLPSGNGVTVRNLAGLARLTGEAQYREEARAILEHFAPQLEQSPRGMTTMALALAEYLDAENDTQESQRSGTQRSGTGVSPVERIAEFPNHRRHAGATPVVQVIPVSQQQKLKKDELVTAKIYLNVDRLPAGRTADILVLLDIKKGWHINTNPAHPDYLIPTSIELKTTQGTKLAKLQFPKGETLRIAGLDDPLNCYTGQVRVLGTVAIPTEAAGKTEEMEVHVRYQACNDQNCLPPKTVKLAGKLAVAPPNEQVRQINEKLFHPPKEEK